MSSGATVVLLDETIYCQPLLRAWIASIFLEGDSTSSAPLFVVKWTDKIMDGFVHRTMEADPSRSATSVNKVRQHLEGTFSFGRIKKYSDVKSPEPPAPVERHVHAAAIHGSVDYVVTMHCSDSAERIDLSYEIYSADDFLVLLDDSATSTVHAVVEIELCRAHARAKAEDGVDLPLLLKEAGAPEFSKRVRGHLQYVDPKILSGDC
ncbi:PIN domain-containing protein [Arthrobacter sp. B1805]|uniref:PIN domain-containing protein n=1 Tax=Arthrobacter sp. B1805 TaxID=2058892 RepID=UPI0011B092D1|nr:PIN domain-containing protein [Arthrobacter sp. B1805]